MCMNKKSYLYNIYEYVLNCRERICIYASDKIHVECINVIKPQLQP